MTTPKPSVFVASVINNRSLQRERLLPTSESGSGESADLEVNAGEVTSEIDSPSIGLLDMVVRPTPQSL